MIPTKVFHIYTKDECIYNNLNEEEFQEKWTELNAMVGLLHTDFSPSDLSYEECTRHWEGIVRILLQNLLVKIHIDILHTYHRL